MCDPVSISLAVGTAVSAASVGYGAMVSSAQSKYEAKVADANAKQASEAARTSQEQGQREQIILMREISQRKGLQRASLAANGIDLDFGSAATMQDDMTQLGREDIAALDRNTEDRTKGLLINAANYRGKAAASRAAANGAMTAGFLNVAGTALSGASQIAKYRAGQSILKGAGSGSKLGYLKGT